MDRLTKEINKYMKNSQEWYKSRLIWLSILTIAGSAIDFIIQYIQGDISERALVSGLIP